MTPGWSPRFVDHVGIVVQDLERSIDLFTSVYGLRKELVEEVEGVGVRLAFLRSADNDQRTTVQLVTPVTPGPVRDFLEQHGEGLHHVCLAVDEIAPVLARIPGEGGSRIFTGGRGRPACFLSGRASGALVELTELGGSVGSGGPDLDP